MAGTDPVDAMPAIIGPRACACGVAHVSRGDSLVGSRKFLIAPNPAACPGSESSARVCARCATPPSGLTSAASVSSGPTSGPRGGARRPSPPPVHWRECRHRTQAGAGDWPGLRVSGISSPRGLVSLGSRPLLFHCRTTSSSPSSRQPAPMTVTSATGEDKRHRTSALRRRPTVPGLGYYGDPGVRDKRPTAAGRPWLTLRGRTKGASACCRDS